MANTEIRKAIIEKGLKHFEVAHACGVSPYTFCRWLQLELPEQKKNKILKVIQEYEQKEEI